MAREERKNLIQEIENNRNSRVLCYITGDRNPTPAQIGDDAIRPIYDQLRSIGKVNKLDLFIYSRGGAIDVPWRIVSALRNYSKEWNILIPFRANSAATLLALGADNIILGSLGELGPIDPIMNIRKVVPGSGGSSTIIQEVLNVEDIMAYIRFVKEKGGLSDQSVLSNSLIKLTDRIDAISLGSAFRTHSHIRDVAKRILLSRSKPASEQILDTIIETLAEKVYAHGHAIGFKSAKEIGLPVHEATDELNTKMWELLNDYEDELKIRDPLDPAVAIENTDIYNENLCIAIVESNDFIYRCKGKVEVRTKRQMPQSINVPINISFQLPPGINIDQLPAQQQQILQQLVQNAQQSILNSARQAIKDQAPIIGIDISIKGVKWERDQ